MRLHRRSANYREIYPRVLDSGIFGFREWRIIWRVLFVYDMDKIANLKGNKILDSETLKEKISILHY